MPRGDARVWKHYGASYEQLSAHCQQQEQQRAAAGPDSTTGTIRSSPAAGVPSTMPPRGCGSFVAQSGWSLGTTGRDGQLVTQRLQQATEARMEFKPPPPDYKRREMTRTDKSNMPKPDFPNDYKTVTQADFGQDLTKRPDYVKTQPIRPAPAQQLLPVDCSPPLFTTQAQLDFTHPKQRPARTTSTSSTLFGGPVPPPYNVPAGRPCTENAGYNIITGSQQVLTNNAFERFDARDYRRHR